MGQEMGLEWKTERTHAMQFICRNRVPQCLRRVPHRAGGTAGLSAGSVDLEAAETPLS